MPECPLPQLKKVAQHHQNFVILKGHLQLLTKENQWRNMTRMLAQHVPEWWLNMIQNLHVSNNCLYKQFEAH